MKHIDDRFTRELPMPGAKRRPGRPAKPDAITPAERSRAYRLRKKEKAKHPVLPPPVSIFQYEGLVRRFNFYYKKSVHLESSLMLLKQDHDQLAEENERLLNLVAQLRTQLCQGVGAARSPQGEDSAP